MSNWPEPSGAELQEWADQITDPLDDNGFVALTVDEEENIRAEFPRWGVTNYENRAFHRLLATLDAERATMATLRAELEAWRHPDVAPSTPLALEFARLRAIEKAARILSPQGFDEIFTATKSYSFCPHCGTRLAITFVAHKCGQSDFD